MSSTQKYIMYGVGVVTLGAALYMLSLDTDTVSYDPKKHTKEELRKIIHEMFIEGATLYCQKLNLMRQAKASGDFTPDMFDKFVQKQAAEVDEAEQDIFKENGVSEQIVQKLLSLYKDDPEIKDKLSQLERIHGTVFDKEDGEIEHIVCKDMPNGLDEDSYILIYRKQQQCIRYHISQVLQNSGGPTTDVEKQKEQQDKFIAIMKRRPEFQTKSMELYDIRKQFSDIRSDELLMREVYLDFYSKSLQPDNKNGVAYSKRLQIEQKQHNAELEKMLKLNETIPSLKTDPLAAKEEGISKEQKALLGYKMTDDTFVEQEGGKDESQTGIANSLMAKLKQNKEEAEKGESVEKDKEEKKVEEAPKTEDKKDDSAKVGEPEKKEEEKKVEENIGEQNQAKKLDEKKDEDVKAPAVDSKKEDGEKGEQQSPAKETPVETPVETPAQKNEK